MNTLEYAAEYNVQQIDVCFIIFGSEAIEVIWNGPFVVMWTTRNLLSFGSRTVPVCRVLRYDFDGFVRNSCVDY